MLSKETVFNNPVSNYSDHDGRRRSWESVCVATGYGLDNRGVEFQLGQEFSLFHIIQTASGVHLTSYPICTEHKAAGT
jgi:hypothetical protein